MAIELGNTTFDETYTNVEETHEETGGRDARIIKISGVITGLSTVAAIEDRLDDILASVAEADCQTALRLRAGRRMLVRRTGFSREVARDSLTGAFVLTLAADDPYEEAIEETEQPWSITASGDTLVVTPAGTAHSLPRLTVVAGGALVNPSFSDGERTLTYEGTVGLGETLVFDAALSAVTLEGADVTPYVSGVFPRLSPTGTTLMYADDVASIHAATVTVAFRDRWY